MYDRILVPLDETETDDVIVEHLLKLAKIHHSEVFLIRVIHLHTRDELAFETKRTEEYLKKKMELFQKAGIHCRSLIEYGEPEHIIPEKARELNVDLIAMATHGHNWLIDIFFGSVAHKVRHTVSIPVLMIKGKRHH
jgi:nucleotide-binding universal stress UspA family protein